MIRSGHLEFGGGRAHSSTLEGKEIPSQGWQNLVLDFDMAGDAAHWQAQVKLLGQLADLHGHEERLRDHNFVPFFSRSPLSLVNYPLFFCHGLGSAMACARHYFIPSILLLKCTGLLGKQKLGSRRGQVF